MDNTTEKKRGPGRPKKIVKRERTSFNQSRKRLQIALNKELAKDFHIHWFNDQDDRINRATNAGYDFVHENESAGHVGDREVHGDSSDLNKRVSKVVDKDGTVAYAMKLPMEFYNEDLAEKQAKNDGVDEAVRAGKSGGASIANQYGDVKVTRR